MFSFLVQMWTGLVRLLSSLFATSPTKSLVRPGCFAEPLEPRLMLSVAAGAAPTACCCPFCTGAAYKTASASTGAAFVAGGKWSQPQGLGTPITITYSYSNLLDGTLSGGLSNTNIRAAIEEALSRWAAVAPLNFVELPDSGPAPTPNEYSGTGVPMIRFGRRGIDGPNNILAYGYFPGTSGLAGDIHFDSGEVWTVNPTSGYDLLEIALHEVGHTLGLDHEPMPTSGGQNAIMNPYYQRRFRGLGTSFLLADDIAGIRSLYGSGVGSVKPLGSANPNSPFIVSGTTLQVKGTTGDDRFVYNAATGKVSINDVVFTGSLANIRNITFDGKGGNDQADLTGSSAIETVNYRPGQVSLTSATVTVAVTNTRAITVTGGSGDRLIMTDSAGNDTFTASPTEVSFTAGVNTLLARGFKNVEITGSTGNDLAWLYDTTGNDAFLGTPTLARMVGPGGYSVLVQKFDAVYAFASTGNDQATLIGSSYADRLVATPTYAQLSSTNPAYSLTVVKFDKVESQGGAGSDTAYLYDSEGNDVFSATRDASTLSGSNYFLLAIGFENVTAYSTGGNDRAEVYDSAGNDTFTAKGNTGTMSYSGAKVQFVGFQSATLNSQAGGVNKRQVTGVPTFQIEWVGKWS